MNDLILNTNPRGDKILVRGPRRGPRILSTILVILAAIAPMNC